MKIIQVIPQFGLAGAETMCENLTYELRKSGHDVTVISMYDYHSPITDRMENAGVDVRYLNKKHGVDFSMIHQLKRIFHEVHADVVHTHLGCPKYAIPAAMMAGVKHRVHTVHNIAQKESGPAARKLNKFLFKHCGTIPVALTEKVRDTIVAEYKMNPLDIPVIFNGIPLTKCLRKNDYHIDQNRIQLLHIGRFSPAKNHVEMINAVCELHRKYPGLYLKLIGDGELKEQIVAHIHACGAEDFVELFGLTDNVYPHLKQADIFILPSTYEGMPMTLIEAMGSGIPIVAGNVGGIPDMITDGIEGLLCEPTADSITHKIDILIGDEALRKSCAENALLAAQRFSSESMAKKYLKIYSGEKYDIQC